MEANPAVLGCVIIDYVNMDGKPAVSRHHVEEPVARVRVLCKDCFFPKNHRRVSLSIYSLTLGNELTVQDLMTVKKSHQDALGCTPDMTLLLCSLCSFNLAALNLEK